jgi:hypothetical protein
VDDGSPHFQAARCAIGLGRLYWGLTVLAAAWSLVGVVVTWRAAALVLPLLLAGWATAWGALLRAFTAHRRGAWQALVGLAVVGALWPAFEWLVAGPPTVRSLVSAALDVVLLGLLLHRDSRDWVGAEEPQRPRAAQSGGHPDGGH